MPESVYVYVGPRGGVDGWRYPTRDLADEANARYPAAAVIIRLVGQTDESLNSAAVRFMRDLAHLSARARETAVKKLLVAWEEYFPGLIMPEVRAAALAHAISVTTRS